MSEKMFIGEVIARSLKDLNVDVVFGIPGTHIYHIFAALEEYTDIKTIVTRHEMNSVFMADVYGRLKGIPGVAIVTAGPGLTNALTGIGQAYSESSPVLVISGDVPRGMFYDFHGVDMPNVLHQMAIHMSKSSYLVRDSDEVEWVVKNGYHLANSGRKGPVHISIPRDVFNEKVLYKNIEVQAKPDVDIEKAVKISSDMLKGKVICILGPEAGYPEYKENIIRFCEGHQLPFISGTSVIGFLPQDHELFAGFFEKRFVIHPLSEKLVAEADTIVFIGIRPESVDASAIISRASNASNTLFILPSVNSKGMIGFEEDFIDIQIFRIGNKKCIGFYGPINRFLELLSEYGGESTSFNIDFKNEIESRYNAIVEELKHDADASPMNQGVAINIISNYIPKDTNLVVDVGANEVWARDLIAPVRRVRYLYAGAFGSLGFSFGAVAGSKLAKPDRIAVSLSGDGSILMSLMELQTIEFYNIPVKIFVINDGSYGILEHLSLRDLPKRISGDIGTVDFAKTAEAFGIEAIRVSRYEELEDVVREIFRVENKPILVDVVTRKEDVPPIIRRHI